MYTPLDVYASFHEWPDQFDMWFTLVIWVTQFRIENNKANLRDLIAATGLVISNWIQFVDFAACVTLKFDGWPKKNNRACLLYYVKLF